MWFGVVPLWKWIRPWILLAFGAAGWATWFGWNFALDQLIECFVIIGFVAAIIGCAFGIYFLGQWITPKREAIQSSRSVSSLRLVGEVIKAKKQRICPLIDIPEDRA